MTQGWQVYDPRRGEDRRFALRKGECFSSLSSGFWIYETSNVDWSRQVPFLDSAFEALPGQGYLTYLPWAPDASALGERFKRRFPNTHVVSPGMLYVAGLDPGEGPVTTMLAEQTALGGRKSGLWSAGMTRSIEELRDGLSRIRDEADSPVFASAANLSIIHCALCLDDGVDMLLFRLRPGIDDLFEKLVAQM